MDGSYVLSTSVRRFFETEGIAILTMLVRQYKIKVKEEPEFAHESFHERKARILTCKPGLTLTCDFLCLIPLVTNYLSLVQSKYHLCLNYGPE